MDLAVDVIRGIAVVSVAVEELDAGNTSEFKRLIAPVLASHRRVLIDLSALHFIDSSGLGAMLSCLRQLTAKGGELKLCGLSPDVQAAFEIVRLHRILDIHPDRPRALEAFQP